MPFSEAFFKERAILAKSDFEKLLIKSLDCCLIFRDKYSLDDCRYKFFAHFLELNGWLIIQQDQFLRLLDSQEIKFNNQLLHPQHRLTFLDQFDTINRGSYCTNGVFHTEHMLQSITVYMSLNTANDTYSNITKNLLLHLDPSLNNADIKDNRDYLILNTPAQIRNSLHNNGYVGRNISIVVDGNKYSFIEGTQLKYTGWISLHKIFAALIKLLLMILDNPKIARIKYIPEIYKSEQGT